MIAIFQKNYYITFQQKECRTPELLQYVLADSVISQKQYILVLKRLRVLRTELLSCIVQLDCYVYKYHLYCTIHVNRVFF